MSEYLKHPDRVYPAPYIHGRWMVTGPDFEDGSGWSLCVHEDQKCQRCIATFDRQEDAEHAARIHDKWETAVEQGKAAARDIEAHITVHTMVNPDMPHDQISVIQDGREVARIEGIGTEEGFTAPAPQVHELSGIARPSRGIRRPETTGQSQ